MRDDPSIIQGQPIGPSDNGLQAQFDQVNPSLGQPTVPGSQVPGKYGKNGNTFYSDGSMLTNTTTTSTQVANQLKQKQLR